MAGRKGREEDGGKKRAGERWRGGLKMKKLDLSVKVIAFVTTKAESN